MRKKFDLDEYRLSGYQGLAMAIIMQAAVDWRYLCEGHYESKHRNFEELENFFTQDYFPHNHGAFLVGTNEFSDYIFGKLQEERRKAVL